MADFLEKLRAKPPHYRRAVALTIVTVLVSIIFILWLTALVPKISGSGAGVEKEDSGGTPRPFSALTEQFKRLYAGGVKKVTDFVEFGDSIEYVQEEKPPDNLSETPSKSEDLVEEES